MIETKYYCDHCKKEVQDRSELYLLKMTIHKNLDMIVTDGKEICSDCTHEALGIDLTHSKHHDEVSNSFSKIFISIFKRFFSGVKR